MGELSNDGVAAQKALDMLKAGVSEDILYSLFVQCYLCQEVVLASRFPQDHHCSKKLKSEHDDTDYHQMHVLSIADLEVDTTAEIPTDVETDVDT